MRLVLRRAHQARGLLLAAAVAALVATGMVTGLADYNRQAIEAGQRAVTTKAPAQERSVLVSGPAGRTDAEFAKRDAAVRERFAGGLSGVPVTVSGARFGTGRELTGKLGAGSKDPVFVALATLQALPGHADLVTGDWPRAGGAPLQVAVPRRTANRLKITVGDRIPLRDRSTKKDSQVVVAGIWQPRDADDPYWRLAPGVGSTADPDVSSYGPLVLDPADFTATFAGSTTSAGWVAAPALAGADPAQLAGVRSAVADLEETLPDQAGLGSSGTVDTRLDELADRVGRANLVGRSALLTPVLLIVVLGGYALILVAALINEDRRGQTALLRARGAVRGQLAGLAAREAALVVLPAALLAPLLVGQALRAVRDSSSLTSLHLDVRMTALTWVVAGATAVGCLLAMLGPAVRRGGTYVADLAARSRPNQWAVAQRASIDLALVGLAVLAWTQLRQYSSPLAGAGGNLGIDPLLAAAPTLGVLAGAVLALRLLPPATRLAERLVDRRPWTATTLGTWQAGRRPHAGPVLLLALAVGASTLAWSLLSTWQRSLVDQADHQVGADLRVVDTAAPVDRAQQLAALPGVRAALPAWREATQIGRDNTEVAVIALDPAAAPGVLRFNERLTEGPPAAVLRKMVDARPAASTPELPAGARRLTGVLRTPVSNAAGPRPVTVTAMMTTADGGSFLLPLGMSTNDGRPTRFAVDLPGGSGARFRLFGFDVSAGIANPSASGTSSGPDDGSGAVDMIYAFQVTDLHTIGADRTTRAVDLGAGGWRQVASADVPQPPEPIAAPTGLWASRQVTAFSNPYFANPAVHLTVVRDAPEAPVPALVTPQVLTALSLKVGDTTPFPVPGVTMPITIVGVADALPSVGEGGAAVLLDLPSAVDQQLRETGTIRPPAQWWIATDPAEHAAAARAAADLPGVTVLDRVAAARSADRDPYWQGARTGLLAAAGGAVLLALVGLGVDVWATARRRTGELAVLNTLGATPRLLARALLAEQTFLAGAGVTVGLVVGAGVGATIAPLVILTQTAGRPIPAPAFVLPWAPVSAIAVGLLAMALLLGTLVAGRVRQRVAAAQLRIGGDQ